MKIKPMNKKLMIEFDKQERHLVDGITPKAKFIEDNSEEIIKQSGLKKNEYYLIIGHTKKINMFDEKKSFMYYVMFIGVEYAYSRSDNEYYYQFLNLLPNRKETNIINISNVEDYTNKKLSIYSDIIIHKAKIRFEDFIKK